MGMNETSKEIDHGNDWARLHVIAKFPVNCLLSLFFWRICRFLAEFCCFKKNSLLNSLIPG
jgi:hypothetical protein